MARTEKNYSWTMTVVLKDGKTVKCNMPNIGRGHRQSWYATEKAARKALTNEMKWTTDFGNKVTAWAVVDRDGIIEQGC